MTRNLLIFIIALAALLGSLVAAWSTADTRDLNLRGYVDATRDANLPYRVPRLGVNAELAQYDESMLEAQLDLMQQAHVTWIRQEFRWNEIEPRPGEYDWAAADRIVAAIAARPDLHLVAVLMNTPSWASEADDPTTPPLDVSDYTQFTTAFAERYGSTIDHYQIWDEPNLITNWGMTEPRPADYLALLAAAYTAIHGADAEATIIAAALAPTTERGPRNISDLDYLRDLYALGAADVIDAVAAKPYGFDSPPDDRTVSNDVLNFSRIVALREIMVENGDGTTSLWATHWGWNSLPPDWTGAPSIWGSVTGEQRTAYTLAALERAEREWPWLGGMILYHWQPDAPPDDPIWGFALVDSQNQPTPLLQALIDRQPPDSATNGLYFPATEYAAYSGVWTFGALGADIGWVDDSRLSFRFNGRDVALLLREDNYVAYLYPTIDGQPANATPKDASGSSYILLTSGSYEPQLSLIPVARDLPDGAHTLELVADRGYDRWALAGFAVSSGDLAAPYNRQIAVALAAAAVSGFAALIAALRIEWARLFTPFSRLVNGLSDTAQLAISAVTSIALLIGMMLTWGDAAPNLLRREPVHLVLAIVTAGLIYLEPGLILTIVAALVLFVLFYHRPDLGLALVIFFAPFFLFPVELYHFAFPMAELLVLILTGAWALRMLVTWGRWRQTSVSQYPGLLRSSMIPRLTTLDYGVATWLLLGIVSLLWTERRAPAITELRTMILEPALFYLIFRTTITDKRTLLRVIDALWIAGVIVAVVGLWLYVQGENIITAEEGARRLASVYGSPNNVALFLGRCIPFTLAFLLLPVDRIRRSASGIALVIMTLAAVLSLSAGGLLLGLPAAFAAVFLLAWRKRAILPLAGLAAVGAAGFALALQSARFARIFDFTQGTNFYRIRVWQSAANILHDHPITGLGLDQFLYAFRGEYIMPDAWQEPNLSHPHNFLLDFWVRLGIFGAALFVLLQIAFWRLAARLYHAYRHDTSLWLAIVVGLMGSMANLLAHGLVDNSVFVNDLAFVFVLLLATTSQLSNLTPSPHQD